MENMIEKLSDFDSEKRFEVLFDVAEIVKTKKIKRTYQQPYDNMHIHSFHSFNYNNWSPSRIIFEAYKIGLKHIGIVDFDTLEALEETLLSSKLFGVPALAGIETRVFIPEFREIVINSPGEPGVYYINALGFTKLPKKNSNAEKIYKKLHKIAENRNKKIVEKLNRFLFPVVIDYEEDVYPLTPSNNPTERHIIKAYIEKSEKISGISSDNFWCEILKILPNDVAKMKKENIGDFMEKIRSVLVKNGGPGYVSPESETFPTIYEFIDMVKESGAVVVGNWLDGTNPGEKDPEKFLEFMLSAGIKVMNIIPERNWNIRNTEEKTIKVANLEAFLSTCIKMNIPVVCGTEMNKYGQPFFDNFNVPELKKHLEWFEKSVELLFGMVK